MVKLCKQCHEEKNSVIINPQYPICLCGYYSNLLPECKKCPDSNCEYRKQNGDYLFKDVDITDEDFDTLTYISQDISFIDAMIKLKQDNIIEYEARMSQFRTQEMQQKQARESKEPRPTQCLATEGESDLQKRIDMPRKPHFEWKLIVIFSGIGLASWLTFEIPMFFIVLLILSVFVTVLAYSLENDKYKLAQKDYYQYLLVEELLKQKEEEQRAKNSPMCPYCHSFNTTKITIISKVVHSALFGIFAVGRNTKNFHCKNCNSDF